MDKNIKQMKSNASLNKSFFRKFGGNTKSINSGIMICHPLQSGVYRGIVFQNNNRLGEFNIQCDDKNETQQADVDLSAFVNGKKEQCGYMGDDKVYNIRSGGYAVFFASRGLDGFHVELLANDNKKQRDAYTTQNLKKGDLVVSMLLRPGAYEVTDSDKSKLKLSVDVPKDNKDYQHYLNTPNMVTLSEKGFEPATIEAKPGQGLVVKLDKDSNLDVKLIKAAEVKVEKGSSKPHRWVKHAPYLINKKK